jgi:AcrR family transcriptional regulator
MSAEARREEIIAVALRQFALTGLHGTSTEAIAAEAGISHAYLFRLFPTKKALFVACAGACAQHVVRTFREAAARYEAGEIPGATRVMDAMGMAYLEMLQDKSLLRSQMQLWVASADDEVRAVAQRGYGEVVQEVERLSGESPEEVRAFMARGMLLNVSAALSLSEIADEPWVQRLLPGLVKEPS